VATELFDLGGKRALVTGASRGIGRTLAIGLAEHGADVFCVARNVTDLEETAKGVRAAGCRSGVLAADLGSEEACRQAVEATVEHLGGIDILVNNAAADHASSVLDTPTETWDHVASVNLRSPYLLCREAGRHLVAQGSGKVINMVSVMAQVAFRDNAAYVTAKHGLLGFTRALALEWARKGVQVNALGPGWIRTEMTAGLWQDERGSDWIVKRTPMGRWGETTDLLGAAVFLASRASDFMTGQAVYVDGGWTVQ
jgi:NAD(P)-dependent dehydrogenase (short-subunit alcohol dehydrogenase family)